MNIEKLSGIAQANNVLLACIVKNLEKVVLHGVKRDFSAASELAIAGFLNSGASDESIDAMRKQLEQIKALLASH
ncbi:hypothetical protein [Paraburkholderia largidicola]|uniref:Uncharacterized protein n=1 Tax=Paraburkholderia largidicola TaxID=3014751 RepID=A0A7I8BJN1_9BURK|nr:hypothetical protein [Paraburkholderia sp. PGU16]BCF88705.1 hypothetical protein PPGU16_17720 [Paraburkholderia sp. PGU16]